MSTSPSETTLGEGRGRSPSPEASGGVPQEGLEVVQPPVAEVPERDADEYDRVSPTIRGITARLVREKSLSYYSAFIKAPEGQVWKLQSAGRRGSSNLYCISEGVLGFFFHGKILELMGIRIPLTYFQQGVLNYLHLAPSQLAPNGWGFVRTFEVLMKYLQREPSVRVFFAFTRITRLPEKNEKGRHAHVGLRGVTGEALFNPVTDSNKGYKRQYFYVRAAN